MKGVLLFNSIMVYRNEYHFGQNSKQKSKRLDLGAEHPPPPRPRYRTLCSTPIPGEVLKIYSRKHFWGEVGPAVQMLFVFWTEGEGLTVLQ